ncbi:MAG: NAD-dependent epimerase/dehydratase family protein [Methylococcaceae bacterium]
MSDKILVLGASSWLGSLLINQLPKDNIEIIGTVFKSNILVPKNVKIIRTDNSVDKYEKIILSYQPTVIINFLRGEDDQGFQLHKKIIALSNTLLIHYVYVSSVLALDAYKNIDLTESLKAKSISPYGIFKAKCEEELYLADISWCILRFSSVQGWVSHKPTRNQIILQRLVNNEVINVDRGVFQNRILATLLTEGILNLIKDKITGIIHFGSQDSSEEYCFLKKQAELFGLNKELIHSGKKRYINLVAVPKKIHELYGHKYIVTENDTLKGLINIDELNKIKA